MDKVFKLLVFGLVALVLSGCSSVEAEKNMTAQDVFEKAKETSTKLQNVRTHISYDDYWKTTAPLERQSIKYDMISEASLHPETFKQTVTVQPAGGTAWVADIYQLEDRVFMKKDHGEIWEELTSGSIAELFGSMIGNVHPTLNLEFFNAFKDDFVLESIDYGYNLKLSLTRDQYKEFKKILFLSNNGSEIEMDVLNSEFPLINRFEIVIGIDINTFYITDFQMMLDTTTYSTTKIDGNSHHEKQTINAIYSYFDNVDTVKIPTAVQDAVAQ